MHADILTTLQSTGLLLRQDKALPNVVSLITGESLNASWWGHPQAQLIFRTLNELAGHPDVLVTKLIAGKVTFVHRDLWPALLAVALAREPWQIHSLSPPAERLLAEMQQRGTVQAAGAAAKQLETRLLVHAEEIHTTSGAHSMLLEPWSDWAEQHDCIPLSSVDTARAVLSAAAQRLGAPPRALPWMKMKR